MDMPIMTDIAAVARRRGAMARCTPGQLRRARPRVLLPLVGNDYWALIATRAAIYWVLVPGSTSRRLCRAARDRLRRAADPRRLYRQRAGRSAIWSRRGRRSPRSPSRAWWARSPA